MTQIDNTSIFIIPSGDRFGMPKEKVNLVYSPLAESTLVVHDSELPMLKAAVRGEKASKEFCETAALLTTFTPIEERTDQIRSPRDFVTLYILPNYICNFHCTYCYAAQGRDHTQLNDEILKRMLEWMVDPKRTPYRHLYVTFLGGGEPMLSWKSVKSGIEYGAVLAAQKGFEISFSVVTNGSKMDMEIAECFRKYHVVPRFSFEVLPEIQEKQRGHHKEVFQNLIFAQEQGLKPVIRSMITMDNVDRMQEMVQYVADKFPSVHLLKLDPITDVETFSDLNAMRLFYDAFYDNFLLAMDLGKELNIEVKCAAQRNMDSLVQRFCAGEICLTPMGTITVCHRISSPHENHYEQVVYGKVTPQKVEIDYQRFAALTSDKVQTQTQCNDCFVKYHCGGGCMAQNLLYSQEMQQVVCNYTRKLAHTLLLKNLDEQLLEENGISLQEILEQEKDTNE